MSSVRVVAIVVVVLAVGAALFLAFRGPEGEGAPGPGVESAAGPEHPAAGTAARLPRAPVPARGSKVGPRVVAGLVVDASGTCLSGVELALAWDGDEAEAAAPFPAGADTNPLRLLELARRARERWRVEARTGADGRFLLKGKGKGPYRLTARKEGYGTEVIRGISDRGGEEMLLVLREAAAVEGIVVSAGDGLPVGGARVSEGPERTLTGAEGRFSLGNLRPGKLEIEVRAPAFRPATLLARTEAGRTTGGHRVELEPGPGITGRVKGPDGKPVGGAAVMLVGGVAVSARVQTDARGRFAFDPPAPGPVTLVATHPGHGPARLGGLRYRAGSRLAGVVLTLTDQGVIEGEVREASGAPVAGVTVKAAEEKASLGMQPLEESGTTDEAGRYRITGLGTGLYDLSARSPDHRPVRVAGVAVTAGRTTRRDLVLEPGLSITGTIRDRRGAPVAGARVTAAPTGGVPGMRALLGVVTVESGADGRYRLGGLPEGNLDLTVRKEGLAGATRKDVAPGSEGVDFVLEDLGSVSGVVLLEESRKPLPGVTVEVTRARFPQNPALPGFQPVGEAETDESGRFRVEGLEPGTYTLAVYPEDRAPGRVTGVTVKGGEDAAGHEILVGRGASIAGIVVAAGGGGPVAGAEVSADLSGEFLLALVGIGRRRTAVTGEDGRFLLAGLPGGPATLKVTHPGYAERQVAGVKPGGGDVVVELLAGGTVMVRVLGRGGTPEAGSLVLLQRQLPYTQLMGTTGGDGVARFERVPPGTWMAMRMDMNSIRRRGPAGLDLNLKTVQVADGETVEVVLAPKPGSVVRGRVLRDGKAVSGVMVFLLGTEAGAGAIENMKFGVTDGEGRYELTDVAPGRHTLAVSRPGAFTPGFSVEVTVEPGRETTRDIELPRTGAAGRVVDEAGKPVAGAQVSLVPSRLAGFRTGEMGETLKAFGSLTTADEEGRFRFEGLAPGEYVARAVREGRAAAYSDPFAVPEFGRGPEDIVIRLPRGSEVAVLVRDAAGKPVAGAFVYVTDDRGRTVPLSLMVAVQTAADGSAALRLAPGDYRVEVQKAGLPVVFAPLHVGGGGGSLEVVIPEPARLEVVVLGPGGAPVPGVAVDLLDEEGRSVVRRASADYVKDSGDRTRTDGEGRITFPLVAPGASRVRAVPGDGPPVTKEVRVRAGERGSVVLHTR